MKKKFYITTAIDYANAAPHLGHAYEKITADVLARWHRLNGVDTFFLTGTDEHGAKIVRSAEKAGSPPADFVAKNRELVKALLHEADISNDDFIYTSDTERHWPAVTQLWNILDANDDLYKTSYTGLYCVGHEAFVTEKDLVDGKCVDHDAIPEKISEENYFFKLSKYADDVRKRIESDELKILPEGRKQEILAFFDEGVEDVSFSRPSKDISWGVPVPNDPLHTMYVWADALPNYISALGFGTDDDSRFKRFWPCDIHLIGKDILRFHAVIWPAMLLSANLPLPKAIFVHGMVLSGGRKMSKTVGNVIDPNEMIHEYGADAFRYYVTREIPFGGDGDFTKERMAEVYEGSLAHGIGNLVSRTAAMVQKYFPDGIHRPTDQMLATVPTKRILHQEVTGSHMTLESEGLDLYFGGVIEVAFRKAMEEYRITDAITILSNFFISLDGYIQDYEPFKLIKEDEERTAAVLWNIATHISRASQLLYPFMPDTAEKILHTFGFQLSGDNTPDRIHVVEKPALFPSKKERS